MLTVHLLAPPIGSVEVMSSFEPAATTHNFAVGHETKEGVEYDPLERFVSMSVLCQAVAPAAGSVVVNASP